MTKIKPMAATVASIVELDRERAAILSRNPALAAEEAEREKKRIAEEAEREKVRRFSPVGTAYNLKLITVPIPGGLASIWPGTELKVTKNSDGTLHVQKGDLAVDVAPSAVTNDRDLAAELRQEPTPTPHY